MRSIACRRCSFFVEFDEPYCPNCGTTAPASRWLRLRDLITNHLSQEAAAELSDDRIRAAVAATSLGHGLLWVAAHKNLGLPWPLWLLGLASIPVLSWMASKYRLSILGYFTAMFVGMVCLFSRSRDTFATLWTMGAPAVGWLGGALGALAKRYLQRPTGEIRATLAGRERTLRSLLPALQTSDDLCREAIATLPRGAARGDGFRLLQQQRSRVREELRLRHSQLQLIDVARWMNRFEPILSELEALDAERCEQHRDTVAMLEQEASQMKTRWTREADDVVGVSETALAMIDRGLELCRKIWQRLALRHSAWTMARVAREGQSLIRSVEQECLTERMELIDARADVASFTEMLQVWNRELSTTVWREPEEMPEDPALR